jgi:hypothetical protein
MIYPKINVEETFDELVRDFPGGVHLRGSTCAEPPFQRDKIFHLFDSQPFHKPPRSSNAISFLDRIRYAKRPKDGCGVQRSPGPVLAKLSLSEDGNSRLHPGTPRRERLLEGATYRLILTDKKLLFAARRFIEGERTRREQIQSWAFHWAKQN